MWFDSTTAHINTKKQKQMNKNTEQIINLLHQVFFKMVKIEDCLADIKQTVEANSSNAYECELAYEKEKIARQKLRQIEYERWFEENYGEKREEVKNGHNS